MISAPLRTTKTQTAPSEPATPSVKTHGHLALLEWDETLPTAPAAAPKPFGLHPRSFMDRCYDAGTLVLLAVSAGALLASLARF